MTHEVVAKQLGRESCVCDVIKRKRACVHVTLLGSLDVLQQTDDEESKYKIKKRKSWWVRPWIARLQLFVAHSMLWLSKLKWRTPPNICRLCPDEYTASSISPRRCFAVNCPKRQSHVRHNTTRWAPSCNSSLFSASILHNNYVNVMLTFQWFDLVQMVSFASTITVYFIRISWNCAIHREQQPSAGCAGKACLFINK